MTKSFFATLTFLAVSTSIASANGYSASGDYDITSKSQYYIEQNFGWGNQANIDHQGHSYWGWKSGLLSGVLQNGSAHKVTLTSIGEANQTKIYQSGYGNESNVYSNGVDNIIYIEQNSYWNWSPKQLANATIHLGARNTINILQGQYDNGDGNRASVEIGSGYASNNNQVDVKQGYDKQGFNNEASVSVNGFNNEVNLNQNGDYNSSTITQYGDYNTADSVINGYANKSKIEQIGNENFSLNDNYGAFSNTYISQIGTRNRAGIVNTSIESQSTINQRGIDNDQVYNNRAGISDIFGSFNETKINQEGSYNDAISTISYSNENSVNINQTESSKYSAVNVILNGSNGNRVSVNQHHSNSYTGGNNAYVNLDYANYNQINLTQYNGGNTAEIRVNGNYHNIDLTQYGQQYNSITRY